MISKDLQRRDYEVMPAIMVLSGLSETEAEFFAWNLGNLEVRSRVRGAQVVVVVSTINFRPRGHVV